MKRANKKVRIVCTNESPDLEKVTNDAILDEFQNGWHVKYIKPLPESEHHIDRVFILFTHADFPPKGSADDQ